MSKKLRLVLGLALLAVLLLPAVVLADFYTRGNPCHAERTTYYSDATRTTVVGVDEYICWGGHRVTGQRTPYYTYQYLGQCCSVCTSQGVCGVEP
ncbi:MAG TPA: hypothetical protein VIP46_10235 [Pyrinomonadaceae bacterium]